MGLGSHRLLELARVLRDSSPEERLSAISEIAQGLLGRVREKKPMRLGMFRDPRQSTEKDFEIAEWCPETPPESRS